jgi:hypothetical protein
MLEKHSDHNLIFSVMSEHRRVVHSLEAASVEIDASRRRLAEVDRKLISSGPRRARGWTALAAYTANAVMGNMSRAVVGRSRWTSCCRASFGHAEASDQCVVGSCGSFARSCAANSRSTRSIFSVVVSLRVVLSTI